MATRGQVAKAVRENKERHPELYCRDPRCLWALRSGPCRKHDTDEAAHQDAMNATEEGMPNIEMDDGQ